MKGVDYIFLDEFSNKGIALNLTYYSLNDLDTGIFLNEIANNKDFFENEFNKVSTNAITIDDFVKYLISLKISKFVDDKNISTNDVDSLKRVEINRGTIVKFINTNYKNIFSINCKNVIHLKEETLNIIMDNVSGIDENVFKYLADKHPLLIRIKYKELYKNKKNRNKFELVFRKIMCSLSKRLFEDSNFIYSYDNKFLINICVFMYKKDGLSEDLKSRVQDIINYEYDFAESIKNSTDKLYTNRDVLDKIRYLLKHVNDNRYKDVNNYIKKYDKEISSYVQKYGMRFSHKILLDDALKIWDKISNPVLKSSYITHSNINEPFIVPKNFESPIIDSAVSNNNETNDYFTNSRQNYLNSNFQLEKGIMLTILMDRKRTIELLASMENTLEYLKECFRNDNIYNFGMILLNNLNILSENLNKIDDNEYTKKTLLYNVGSIACFMCEKLLKQNFEINNKDKNDEYNTLTNYLSEKGVSKAFTFDHLQSLKYFLVHSGEYKSIGYNFRNDFAHLNNFSDEGLNLPEIAGIIYIFLDVLNSLTLMMILKNNK